MGWKIRGMMEEMLARISSAAAVRKAMVWGLVGGDGLARRLKEEEEGRGDEELRWSSNAVNLCLQVGTGICMLCDCTSSLHLFCDDETIP